MKIKSKIKLLEEFVLLREEISPGDKQKEDPAKEINPDLSIEIDDILDKLKELEINLDPPAPSQTTEKLNILENIVNEEGEGYNDGYQAGKAAVQSAKTAAAVVGGAIALGALLGYAMLRSKKRMKKRIKAYGEYYPKKGKLEINKEYSDRMFNMSGVIEEETAKKIEAFKEKVQQKIDATDDNGKKEKIRELRDKKIESIKELINKKYDAKKQKEKAKIEKDIEQLDTMWKLTLQETDISSFFDKLSQTEGQTKMNRKWEEGKLDIEKKEDPALASYEKSLIEKIYDNDADQLDKSINNIDIQLEKKEKEYKAVEASIEEKKVKEKEIETKRENKEVEKEKNNPKYKEAKAEEQKFIAAERGFTDAISKYGANQTPEYKDELTKAYNKLKLENKLTGKGTKVLKNDSPPASEEQIEKFTKARADLMGAYKKQYDSMVKSENKEEPKESKTIKLSKKLNEYSKFKIKQ